MRKFKLAALPFAVAGVIASNSAFAGTEACFEVYKGADDAALSVADFDTVYTSASCVAEADRTGAAAADLEPTNEAAIAYELTGDLDVDFDATDAVDTDLQIVYIPTTDIPSGTLITMDITGATFANNGDIIHLVQDDVLGDDTGATERTFSAVASTDGAVDGETTITFLTKAGVTITAGTRLVLSGVASGATAADIEPVSINITNEVCTDPTSTQSVTLRATSAVTDGGTGFSIAGAASSDQLIADISPQFVTFSGSSSVDGEVNAESTDHNGAGVVARTEFVYEDNSLVFNASQVLSVSGFADRIPLLDQAITLDADDHLHTKFITSSDPGADVEAGIYNSQTAATGVLAAQIDVETGTAFGTISQDSGTATEYMTEATDLFTAVAGTQAETAPVALAGSTYNDVWYVVENTDPGVGVMNFNYTHTPEYTLDFGTAGELDHCASSKELHNIGVNGAVLKVPYSFTTDGNFVRITNEHSESAEITLDLFDESGNEVYNVGVGTVGEHASVVLLASDLLASAVADGYVGTGSRHTMTFTVTAPRNSVHGVSVQKIPGGVDRVMPVLDQNDWSQ